LLKHRSVSIGVQPEGVVGIDQDSFGAVHDSRYISRLRAIAAKQPMLSEGPQIAHGLTQD
jgi:hypothetical protein